MLTTYAEVKAEFDRLSWGMPGWTMELWDVSMDGLLAVQLVLTATVRDTYRPDDTTLHRVAHAQALPLPVHAEDLPMLVRTCIHAAVVHEADEWLRQDGVMRWNPHERR